MIKQGGRYYRLQEEKGLMTQPLCVYMRLVVCVCVSQVEKDSADPVDISVCILCTYKFYIDMCK